LAGEYLTATCNTNMFTYEIAPVFILMEHATFSKMREIIGFTGGDSIMAPGNNSFYYKNYFTFQFVNL
jgi:glutamate decarboxylase